MFKEGLHLKPKFSEHVLSAISKLLRLIWKKKKYRHPENSVWETQHVTSTFKFLKGCGMGTLLILVSPCFRENVVVTCKIGSFLCSLDNLLQKNIIVFFFWKSNFNMALIWKKGLLLTYFSHFLVTREKLQKFLQHISHSHTYMYFAHPIDFFCLTNFEKKNMNLSGMVSLWYQSWCWFLFVPFWNNQ